MDRLQDLEGKTKMNIRGILERVSNVGTASYSYKEVGTIEISTEESRLFEEDRIELLKAFIKEIEKIGWRIK